jgi:hypothetical protein
VPVRFNRHASTNSGVAAQITDANAVAGVMLATALLRELTELESRNIDRWATT